MIGEPRETPKQEEDLPPGPEAPEKKSFEERLHEVEDVKLDAFKYNPEGRPDFSEEEAKKRFKKFLVSALEKSNFNKALPPEHKPEEEQALSNLEMSALAIDDTRFKIENERLKASSL